MEDLDIEKSYSIFNLDDDSTKNVTEVKNLDEIKETCPICFEGLIKKNSATIDSCDHIFCRACIDQWSKEGRFCPVDRKVFHKITILDSGTTIEVKALKKKKEKTLYDVTRSCEVCNSNNGGILLLCDSCDLSFHCNCLTPPLLNIPASSWQCPECLAIDRRLKKKKPSKKSNKHIYRKKYALGFATGKLKPCDTARRLQMQTTLPNKRKTFSKALENIQRGFNKQTSKNATDYSDEPHSPDHLTSSNNFISLKPCTERQKLQNVDPFNRDLTKKQNSPTKEFNDNIGSNEVQCSEIKSQAYNNDNGIQEPCSAGNEFVILNSNRNNLKAKKTLKGFKKFSGKSCLNATNFIVPEKSIYPHVSFSSKINAAINPSLSKKSESSIAKESSVHCTNSTGMELQQNSLHISEILQDNKKTRAKETHNHFYRKKYVTTARKLRLQEKKKFHSKRTSFTKTLENIQTCLDKEASPNHHFPFEEPHSPNNCAPYNSTTSLNSRTKRQKNPPNFSFKNKDFDKKLTSPAKILIDRIRSSDGECSQLKMDTHHKNILEDSSTHNNSLNLISDQGHSKEKELNKSLKNSDCKSDLIENVHEVFDTQVGSSSEITESSNSSGPSVVNDQSDLTLENCFPLECSQSSETVPSATLKRKNYLLPETSNKYFVQSLSDCKSDLKKSFSVFQFKKVGNGKVHEDNLVQPGFNIEFILGSAHKYNVNYNKTFVNTKYEIIKQATGDINSCKLTIPTELLHVFSEHELRYLAIRKNGALYLNWRNDPIFRAI